MKNMRLKPHIYRFGCRGTWLCEMSVFRFALGTSPVDAYNRWRAIYTAP